MTITAKPVVWVTVEERRRMLWEIARERILGDCAVPSEAPQPTGGICNAQSSDEIADQISLQDEQNTHLRRKSKQKKTEQEQSSDETLRAGAAEKLIRLGVQERVVDVASQGIAATMIVANKGVVEARTRITSKTGANRSGRRRLLHPGNLLNPKVEPGNGLGTSSTVVHRNAGEHNQGSRVIA